MTNKSSIKILGVGGVARSGKNTFCDIAQKLLEANDFKVRQFSFAEEVKSDLAEFVKSKCGIDIYNMTPEEKESIRPLMVWYGTDYWRKKNNNIWIEKLEAKIYDSKQKYDVALISDVRYENESVWIKNKNGCVVHLTKTMTGKDSYGNIIL